MSRKRTWKFCGIPSSDAVRQLDAYRRSNRGAWAQYTIVLGHISGLETDMPWSELRRWFSYAGVPMPQMGSSDDPSWVIYDETPEVQKAWPTGPALEWDDMNTTAEPGGESRQDG